MPAEARVTPLRIGVVEDIRDSREALAFIINHAEGMNCVGAVASAEEALAKFPSLKPELVLLDVQLAGKMTGTEGIERLKEAMPSIRIVMLTINNDAPTVTRCLMNGAIGYLHKSLPPDRLPHSIREAAAGGSPMSPEIAQLVMQVFQAFATTKKEWEKLSPREQEVLELLARGFLRKEIAERLGISEETVKSHLDRIYQKLHVTCREHAVAKALPMAALQWMKQPGKKK